MASITYTIQTDDGTTVNTSHTVSITDDALNDFLTALGAQMPGASNAQILLAWVNSGMQRAVGMVQSYKQAIVTPPTPITYEIVS